MQIEVWSDIACPYCYIGKRRLERALAAFEGADRVRPLYRSFQLDPELSAGAGMPLVRYMTELRGYDPEAFRRGNEQLAEMGRELGIEFDFARAVAANTLDAHRLLQLAGARGVQAEMKELLLRAYFTEGRRVDDREVLAALAAAVSIDDAALAEAWSGAYDEAVSRDVYEARQLGARGVPFFVFNDKYIVRGAQPQEIFDGALRQSFGEWEGGKTERLKD